MKFAFLVNISIDIIQIDFYNFYGFNIIEVISRYIGIDIIGKVSGQTVNNIIDLGYFILKPINVFYQLYRLLLLLRIKNHFVFSFIIIKLR